MEPPGLDEGAGGVGLLAMTIYLLGGGGAVGALGVGRVFVSGEGLLAICFYFLGLGGGGADGALARGCCDLVCGVGGRAVGLTDGDGF